MKSVNPATGATTATYDEHDDATVDARLEAADERASSWRRVPLEVRAELLRRVAEHLRAGAEGFGRLMATEMGKPISDGRAEAEKCAWACEHYAEHGPRYLAREEVDGVEAARAFVSYQPLGVILAIMPWNFPFWQVFRCAAPAIMAGNPVVLKHATSVPGCALAIEKVFADAGAPEALFTTLLVSSERMDRVIADPTIRGVTLTGSVGAGRKVAATTGDRLKPTVLELGGSDPYVVLADADLDHTVETCVAARMINNGQSCIAGKRFIVVDAVFEEFERRFVRRMRAIEMVDPLDPTSTLGPMARKDLRDDLHDQVERSVAAGARLVLGGEVPELPGWWYPPTVLVDVRPGVPAFDEETFGPVAALVRAKDEDDALRLANHSSFGLGAAIFTADAERGARLAEEHLEAGVCCVNLQVKSDPRLPFGGVKDSGYGRELGAHGIRALCNVKTVWVARPGGE